MTEGPGAYRSGALLFFWVWIMGGGQLLRPPAGPVRALNRQNRISRPRPGAKNAPGRGLCLCSILKTAVDYLWQFTKIERPLDKCIGGGGVE